MSAVRTAGGREKHAHQLIAEEHGPAAQQALAEARVVVVGADEIGAPVAAHLAEAGIGRLCVVDGAAPQPWDDYLDLPDGTAQTRAAAWLPTLRRIAAGAAEGPPDAVQAVARRLGPDDALAVVSGADVVVCGNEDPAYCRLVGDACAVAGVPFVWAGLTATTGAVTVLGHGAGPVFADLPADVVQPYFRGMAGVAPLTGTAIGLLAAAEVIKLVTGAGTPLVGRVLHLDLAGGVAETRPLAAAARGPAPATLTAYEPYFGLLSADAAAAAREATISVEQLKSMLDAAEPIVLVDVRERHEFEYARIEGSVLVPKGGFFGGDALASLPTDRRLVFVCRAGIRSAEVLAVARRAGRADSVHVGGGVVAWADRIDPAMPTY